MFRIFSKKGPETRIVDKDNTIEPTHSLAVINPKSDSNGSVLNTGANARSLSLVSRLKNQVRGLFERSGLDESSDAHGGIQVHPDVKSAIFAILLGRHAVEEKYVLEHKKAVELQTKMIIDRVEEVLNEDIGLEIFSQLPIAQKLKICAGMLLESGVTNQYDIRAVCTMLEIRLQKLAVFEDDDQVFADTENPTNTQISVDSGVSGDLETMKQWYLYVLRKYFKTVSVDEKIQLMEQTTPKNHLFDDSYSTISRLTLATLLIYMISVFHETRQSFEQVARLESTKKVG